MKIKSLILAASMLVPTTVFAADDAVKNACGGLRGLSIPAEAIGLPTSGADIHTSQFVEGDSSFCQLTGSIDPVDPAAQDINFQINLPADWNGKGLHFGGGGYDGNLVTGLAQARFNPDDKPTPLQKGYVTWGSDSGHQPGGFWATFLLNEESTANFGGDQLKKTHDIALFIIDKVYGKSPELVYFQGNSQGGHEGMIVSQRWPEDYDGVIVMHPANSFTGLQLSGNIAGQAMYQKDAWIDKDDVALLNSSVYKTCDALDGAMDGVVSNIKACGETFDIASLRCEDGMPNHGTCFGGAQIKALNIINTRVDTPPLQGGAQGFAGWPIFLGADLYGIWGTGFTPEPTSPPSPVANFGLLVLADPLIRFGIVQDPDMNSLEFDQSKYAARITELSNIIDAVSDDMTPFAAKGGKMLLAHGTIDFAIPFGNTVDWYERVVAKMGQEKTSDFMKFWLIPGFGHGSGVFQIRWDSLEALENWVENGVEPANLIATDAAEATAGRTRPLCEYPGYAKLNDGAIDLTVASSYSCAN